MSGADAPSARILRPATASPDDPAIAEAARLIRAGYPVALPTETVYGLAADAASETAAARVFEAKGRPRFDPLIVHLPAREWLPRAAVVPPELEPLLAKIAERFWPGPLTILLPRAESIPDLVTSGSPLVAVRLPAHPVFRAVAAAADRPLAAPSANRFGRISPTDAEAVLEELGSRIPLVLDCGPTAHGIESTIIEPLRDGSGVVIRRPGPVTAEELRSCCAVADPAALPRSAAVTPGGLESHYAPATPLRLFSGPADLPAETPDERLGVVFWDAPPPGFRAARIERWSESGSLVEAAARLFRLLRGLDHAGLDAILVQSVPETGLGVAINDRLRRAAAKRRRQGARRETGLH